MARGVHRKIFTDQVGSTTVMVAILAAAMLLVAGAMVNLNRGSKLGGVEQLRFYNAVDMIKANIYFFGQNYDAWLETLAYNQAAGRMTCINSGSDCVVNASLSSDERVVLVLPNGTVYYDTTVNGKDGFRYNGTVCDYVSTAITGGCAIQADVRWRPFCEVGCTVGTYNARVAFHVFFSTPAKTHKDRERWGFNFKSSRTDGLILF